MREVEGLFAQSMRPTVPGCGRCDIPGDQDGESVPRPNEHTGQHSAGRIHGITRHGDLSRGFPTVRSMVQTGHDKGIAAPSTLRECVFGVSIRESPNRRHVITLWMVAGKG